MFQVVQMLSLSFSVLAVVVSLVVLVRAFRLMELAEAKIRGRKTRSRKGDK